MHLEAVSEVLEHRLGENPPANEWSLSPERHREAHSPILPLGCLTAPQGSGDTAPIRVLLVEDNPTDVFLLQELLAEAWSTSSFRVTHVERLGAAVQRLWIGALRALAKASLVTDANTTKQTPQRGYQECLKVLLDEVNNNGNPPAPSSYNCPLRSTLSGIPCPFTSPY